MNLPAENESASAATIFAVALPPEKTIPVLDAAEAAGFGIRQYPNVESLLDSTAPVSQGCVLISGDEISSANPTAVERLKSHFRSAPFIALLDQNSADSAVDLMRMGAYSVLTKPFEHQKLVSTMTSAVRTSISHQTTHDSCREAAVRMGEATEKELEVLRLVMEGRKNKEIAGVLGITVRAVEDRRFRLMKKVGVESVAELVTLAVTARYYEQGMAVAGPNNAVSADPKQCLKGIEVWVPSEDESCLEAAQCLYCDAALFRKESRGITFRRGEGLPGLVWERRAPAFLKELITEDFVRSSAAGAVGMTAAVGFPVFCNERVEAVVLLLLDSRHQGKAAFEAWRVDPRTDALRLFNGTYVNCEKLRRLTEFVHLPVGDGLAGVAAERGRPWIGARFGDDVTAVRGLALAAEQLVSGVALPLTDSGSVTSDVFMLFNGENSSVFSLLQVWKVNDAGLTLAAEYAEGIPSLEVQMAKIVLTENSIAAECRRTGMPVVSDVGSSQRICHSPTISAPTFGIAVPTLIKGKVVAVTVLAN